MDNIEMYQYCLKQCRELLDKQDADFTEQDRLKLISLNIQLNRLEKMLPEDYFTAEKSWQRFLKRL